MRVVYVLGAVSALAMLPADLHRVAPPPVLPAEPALAIAPAVAPPHAPELARPAADRDTLSVRVIAAGLPVAGAEVSISDGSRPTLMTRVSDAEGVVRFSDLAPGPYELWARREAMVSSLARVSTPGSATAVSLALAPATTLRGQLIADAVPHGATVTLVPVDVDHAMRTASVDDRGRFEIAGVPAGHWRIEGAAAGFVQTGDTVIAVDRDRSDVAVPMARTGAVTGTVVDGDGAPVAHATIVLHRLGAAPIDDEAQRVATRRRWVHPLAGHRVLPPGDALRFGAPRSGARPAECGQGHCGVDIGYVRGTVIHAAADGEIALAYSDSHGEAGRSIAIDHGNGLRSYYMHLDSLRPGLEIGQRVRAGDALGAMGSTGLAHGPHLHFAITQEREGRTWYVDPEPVLRQAVVLAQSRSLDPIDGRDATAIAALRSAPTGELDTIAPQTVTTDALGHFRVDGVAPGSYVAVAFAPALAPGSSDGFAVASGAAAGGLAIVLHPGALVRGRVTASGAPVAGATVVAGAGSGESAHKIASTTTSARGDYVLRALSGTVTVAITAPGHGTIERTLELDGSKPVDADFALTLENAQLRGQVLAPDGGPVAGATIRVVDGPTRRRATTDALGRFAFDHAAAGDYVLEVTSEAYPPARIPAHADRWSEIRLARGGAVHCDVRDRSTAGPLAGLAVEASGPGRATATAITDARGFADLRGLAPGTWTVRVRARGYTPVERTLVVRPSTLPDDVRLELARGAILAGVVRDRTGHRVGGARVFVGSAETRTDGDGNFRLEAPAGRYWLEAELGDARGAVDLSIEPGGDRATIEVALDR